jgi:hypothetical protein
MDSLAFGLPEFVGALFVAPQVREQALAELERTILVRLGPFERAQRGMLMALLRDALSTAFARRDLDPSAFRATNRASTLLYGAGRAGEDYGLLVVTFETLLPLTNERGALDGEDSRVLRDLLLAAETCDVTVVLDPEDAHIEVFGPTVALSSLLPAAFGTLDLGKDEEGSLYPSEPPTLAATPDSERLVAPEPAAELPEEVDVDDAVALFEASMLPDYAPEDAPAPQAAVLLADSPLAPEEAGEHAEEILEVDVDAEILEAQALEEDEAVDDAVEVAHVAADVGVEADLPDVPVAVSLPAAAPLPPKKTDENWRTLASALESLDGPQPLSALERMFTAAYVPLGEMIQAGLADARAQTAHQAFGANFAHVYRDASATMGHRHKLPRMVMDAPDLAAKEAREAGARSLVLLYCDGLRYDLGLRVRDELEARCADFATLVGESLLWAALPSTTPRQVETLIRGREALGTPYEPVSESTALRDRTADVVRRVRMGSREMFKLDLIEARLRGPSYDAAALAGEIADVVARFARRELTERKQRTLLYLFGDHGFAFDRGVAVQGGALPEQVLVPAQAWALDAVH